ncbi:MAG: peptide deformylase [Sphaerochaetaceae bacterium]|nr:peptide deformylase [Sphaerochaetaceae bacterium]
MLDIYKLGEDVLSEPTTKVTEFDSALKLLVEAMFETMDEAEGVGLAAPQIGVSKRIFVVDTHQSEDERLCFINPEILETSPDLVHYEEGCLSVPGVYHDVVRPSHVTVHAQDLNGKAFTVKAGGLLARVIQHENDHLYGKLFIDRLDKDEHDMMVRVYERRAKSQNKGKKRSRR